MTATKPTPTIEALLDLLEQCRPYVADCIDCEDGPDGQPMPNEAASICNHIDLVLGDLP